MSNTSIQLKKSGFSGNTPGDLSHGELALNYADGKLYYKSDLGGINNITNQESFATISANSSLILASSPSDYLSINPANSITILGDGITKSITIGLNESQITSFVKKSGDSMTGDLDISANVAANYIVVNNTLYSGLATRSSTPLPNLIAQFTGNTNSYVQVNAQNIDEYGSADFVVTADVGDDTTFFIDMGIQGSQLNQGTFYALDGYLYVHGNTGQPSGNLILGTTSGTAGLETRIVAGGDQEENVVIRFNTAGANLTGDLITSGNITSPTITLLNDYTQSAFNKANAGGGNSFSTISSVGSPDIYANTSNSVLTFVATTGIAIGLGSDSQNTVINIGTNLIGASNVIVDYGQVSDVLGTITFDYGFVS
jgi:hypothetical protein